MKNVISYALGLFLLASAAQAAPFALLPKAGSASADRKAVNTARVKLMNDARKLGPDSAQVQQDKEALINALEKLRGDANSGPTRPVNVKRNPKKVAKHKAKRTMAAKTRAPRKAKHRKVSHLRTRKPARSV